MTQLPSLCLTTRKRYDLHINTAPTGKVLAAECVLEEEGGSLRRVGFRYRPEYAAAAGVDEQEAELVAKFFCQ